MEGVAALRAIGPLSYGQPGRTGDCPRGEAGRREAKRVGSSARLWRTCLRGLNNSVSI